MGNTLKIAAVTIATLTIQCIYSGANVANAAPRLSADRVDSVSGVDTGRQHAVTLSAEQAQNSSSTYVPPVEDGPDRSQGSGTR